jgi:hypothetical protein
MAVVERPTLRSNRPRWAVIVQRGGNEAQH